MSRPYVRTVACIAAASITAAHATTVTTDRALVIHGGGPGAAAAFERFVALAGGSNARIVVIPTAAGHDSYEDFDHLVIRRFRQLGADDVRVLHARSRSEADSDAFAAEIDRAHGVWFTGGRQWRLVDTYLGTKAEQAMHGLLARRGVIGGGSAGATVQGSYLVRGDTRGAYPAMGDHETGFGFLQGVAIDQHLLTRNRQFDLLTVIRARPELLGIGVDENTALVVTGDRFEVVGEGYVAIYDPEIVSNGGYFYFLKRGDRFDLRRRVAYRGSDAHELWIPQIHPPVALREDERRDYCGFYTDGLTSLEIACDDELVVRTDEGETTSIRPVTRDAFVDVYSGAKIAFSAGDNGCVSGMVWLTSSGPLNLKKVD